METLGHGHVLRTICTSIEQAIPMPAMVFMRTPDGKMDGMQENQWGYREDVFLKRLKGNNDIGSVRHQNRLLGDRWNQY